MSITYSVSFGASPMTTVVLESATEAKLPMSKTHLTVTVKLFSGICVLNALLKAVILRV